AKFIMSDNNNDPMNPFFMQSGFPPFVILPTSFTFNQSTTFQEDKMDENQINVNDNDNNDQKDNHDQTEILVDNENNDSKNDTFTNDENIDSDTSNDDKMKSLFKNNNLRISQPKYEKLLKDLDFSECRMVDVTDMLNAETQPNTSYYTPNEEQSLTSSSSSPLILPSRQTVLDNEQNFNFPSNLIDDIHKNIYDQDDEENHFHDDTFQNDLDLLATIIDEAWKNSSKSDTENCEQPPQDNNLYSSKKFTVTDDNEEQKKEILDEDDDTSKQATSNYDFVDNEHEDIQQGIPSKSSKTSRPKRLDNNSEYTSLRQESVPRYIKREKKTLISKSLTESLNNEIPNDQHSSANDQHISSFNPKHSSQATSLTLQRSASSPKNSLQENGDENVTTVTDNSEHILNWGNLVNGSICESTDPVAFVSTDTFLQPAHRQSTEIRTQSNSDSLSKKHPQHKKKLRTTSRPLNTSDEEQPPVSPRRSVKKLNEVEEVPPSLSRSPSILSSDAELLMTKNPDQQQQKVQQENRLIRTKTNVERQDSQATSIDDNLDEFSSQMKTSKMNDKQGYTDYGTNKHREQTSIINEKKSNEKKKQSAYGPSDRPYMTASDILLRRLSNENIEKQQSNDETLSNCHHSSSNRHPVRSHCLSNNINNETTYKNKQFSSNRMEDTWLTMLEKLEREHKERLEHQQMEYKEYIHGLEENMKKRFDDYIVDPTMDSDDYNDNRSYLSTTCRQVRQLSHHKLNDNNTSSSSYNNKLNTAIDRALKRRHYKEPSSIRESLSNDLSMYYYHTRLSRSGSKEDLVQKNVKAEMHAKHNKHVADLKTYYEHEIDELRHELKKYRLKLTKMGLTPSNVSVAPNTPPPSKLSSAITSKPIRQSFETIDRSSHENIRLKHEITDFQDKMKYTDDQNEAHIASLERQIQELRETINEKDRDFENYHRTINKLEEQLTEAENTKERQDEKSRSIDRSLFLYREENEKLKNDLHMTRVIVY
ncbi:unnamed protein product, partial [Didymodactylos carnosus]